MPVTALRYAAFLLTYLPKLRDVALNAPSVDADKPTIAEAAIDAMGLADRFPDMRQRRRSGPLAAALAVDRPGACLQFGVYRGASINHYAARYPQKQFYGFDSFEGFPSDGRNDWEQDFSIGGALPKVRPNVTLIKGYFSETLPEFLKTFRDEVSVVDIDCDIYSSTRDVFAVLGAAGRLLPDLILSFDELINYRGFMANEMFALFEMLERENLSIEWLAVHQNVYDIEEMLQMISDRVNPTWKDSIRAGYRQQASLKLAPGPLDLSILDDPEGRARAKAVALALRRLPKRIKPGFRRA